MSTGTSLTGNPPRNHGQSRAATPTPPPQTHNNASTGSTSAASSTHAAGVQSVNSQLHTPPVPVKQVEALQKAIQQYLDALSDEDKAAFQSAPDIIEQLQKMQRNRKPTISYSLTVRVEKVLQRIQCFMGLFSIFIQKSSEISSLVIGGVNCILTVGNFVFYHCRIPRRGISIYVILG